MLWFFPPLAECFYASFLRADRFKLMSLTDFKFCHVFFIFRDVGGSESVNCFGTPYRLQEKGPAEHVHIGVGQYWDITGLVIPSKFGKRTEPGMPVKVAES